MSLENNIEVALGIHETWQDYTLLEIKELLRTCSCFWNILPPPQKHNEVLHHGLHTCNWLPMSLPVTGFVVKGVWFCLGALHTEDVQQLRDCVKCRKKKNLQSFSVISRGSRSPGNFLFCIALSLLSATWPFFCHDLHSHSYNYCHLYICITHVIFVSSYHRVRSNPSTP